MKTIPSVTPRYSHFEEFGSALDALHGHLGTPRNMEVLEAGAGSVSHVNLADCFVVGIDISRQQLDRNNSVQEKVCADLHEYENASWTGRFDLIISWFVLEHLDSPYAVIDKFLGWVKPTGRIVLAYPQPRSLKGMVTRGTPFFVHRLFYRVVSGTPLSAHKTDEGPIPTVMHPGLRLDRLAAFLRQRAFEIELLLSAESYQTRFIKRFVPAPIVDAINGVLIGTHCPGLDRRADELILVISRRQPEATEPAPPGAT